MKNIVKKSIDDRQSILSDFEKLASQESKFLYEKLLEYLSATNTGGKIIIDDDFFIKVQKIINKLAKDRNVYDTRISNLIRDFDVIGDNAIDITASLNDDLDFDKLKIKNVKKLIIDDVSDRLSGPESFKANIGQDIKRIIIRNSLGDSSFSSLVGELKDAVIGSKAQDGTLNRYVKQIVNDSIYQYQGAINSEIQKEFNLNAIRYTGALIDTSRPQCIRWIEDKNGLLVFKKGIPETGYLPDEVRWAKKNGSGYGTPGKSYYIDLTVNNFTLYRGGYGCLHEAIPFELTDRSLQRSIRLKETFERNIGK